MDIKDIREIIICSVNHLLNKCTLIDVVNVGITNDKHYYFKSYEEFKNDSTNRLYDYYIGFINDEEVIKCYGSGDYEINMDALKRYII